MLGQGKGFIAGVVPVAVPDSADGLPYSVHSPPLRKKLVLESVMMVCLLE